MRNIAKINIEESILRGKLTFDKRLSERLDQVIIYYLCAVMISTPLLALRDADFDNRNDLFLYLTLFPFLALIGAYIIYRKATEMSLVKIESPYKRQIKRQMLLDYAEERAYQVYRKSNDCLILNQPADAFESLNTSHMKSLVLIVDDNAVYFTIIRDLYNVNLPVLITHHLVRRDLKKLFKARS